MTESSIEMEAGSKQYPLSFTQEWFITLDQGDGGGAFGHRFIIVFALRITGPVDVAMLQGALDDVVDRHELLRTVVVRDADPPYQLVYPPLQVPLEVRDVPPVIGKSRDIVAEELIIEAEQGKMNPDQMPLLRASLRRFDDRDSVLLLTTHHSVADEWSMQLIMRDLGACYAARASGQPAKLPAVRQYREYAAWQRAGAADSGADGSPAYWQEKLRGGSEFTLPTDRVVPENYSRPFTRHNYLVDADIMAKASDLATTTRSSMFMVLLAAFYVLAYRITGSTDAALRAFTTGRNDPQFHDTMGLFLNVVPFRTDISDCASFREIVERTRETCIDAYAHELPWGHIEQELTDFTRARREATRATQFILGMPQPQFGDVVLPIAEGAAEIRERMLQEPEHPDIPRGLVWNLLMLPSGALSCALCFNVEEFDEATVTGWASEHVRIMTGAITEPDQAWKTL